MPASQIFPVDRASFVALGLAQAAINFARNALPYGSGNQREDLKQMRPGGDPQG